MRIESEIKVIVKDRVIGGSDALICLPLVAETEGELLLQADQLVKLNPDLFEWRIDYFNDAENTDKCIEVLKELNKKIDPVPLILTCRIHSEGGVKKITDNSRLELLISAMKSECADLIDIELCNEKPFIEEVKKAASLYGTKLIFSYHDFKHTPDKQAVHDKLFLAQELGADIAKIAVMPQNNEDVLKLLDATLKARTGKVRIPIVAMSMGRTGSITRLAGGLFGSDITFAVGEKSSAPGQMPIHELRQAMDLVY